MSSTAVVIVNYRSAGLVVDLLHSLESEGLRVVVADNASPDDSVAVLRSAIAREGWSSVELLSLDRNGGFAYGNNAAIRHLLAGPTPPDYFWLLNPDTIVRPGAAKPLIDVLERRPEVGIVGGGLEGPDGTPQTAAFRFPTFLGEFEIAVRLGLVSGLLERFRIPTPPTIESHDTDWVNGASLMIRRDAIETIGPMDEEYFLYFEETDWCLRALRAGWRVWHEPASRVVHLEGQSTGVTGANRTTRRRPQYWFDSRSRYYRKNHGRTYAFLADVAFIAGLLGWKLHSRLRRKPDQEPPGLLRDFFRDAVGRWI